MLSLWSFLKQNPPLTVFIAGLFSLSVLALAFSLTVSVSSDIRNPDVLDFDGLFERIAKLDFCVKGNNEVDTSDSGRERRALPPVSDEKEEEGSNTENERRGNISVLVPFSTEFVDDLRIAANSESRVLAHGVVLLSHMKKASFGKYEGMHLELTMALPAAAKVENEEPSLMEDKDVDGEKTQNICVLLSAPTAILADLDMSKQKPENCTLPTTRHSKTVEFVTHSKERLPHEWCSGANDTRMALTYETQPVWTVFVSSEDKQRIRMHLFATSAFVFLAAAVVLVTTAWRSRTKTRLKLRSHGTGMTMTKGASDGRGDLEMLPRMSEDSDEDRALT